LPGPAEALVRVERVGICGSDLHIFAGHHPTATLPRVQGHEVSARIDALPPSYDGPLRPGSRVAIDPFIVCGSCYPCSIGHPSCCPNARVLGAHLDGFLQEWAAVPISALHDTSRLTADEACLVEPASIGHHAVARADVQPGEQALIIGGGPIGACIAIACLDRGARVAVADMLPGRLEIARALGVELTLIPGNDDIPARVRDWTRGEGAHVTFDAVGSPAVIRQCVELVAPAGRVVIAGLSDREVSLPIVDFTYKELTILGSRGSGGRFAESVDLVRRRRNAFTRLITHHVPLNQVQSAFDLASSGQSLKVVVDVSPDSDESPS
jgi:L-gulonate 5-dehydrogenase